jgi:hypothetical protein
MSTVVIGARYRTEAITLSRQSIWIRWTISEEMKCATGAATEAGADARLSLAEETPGVARVVNSIFVSH